MLDSCQPHRRLLSWGSALLFAAALVVPAATADAAGTVLKSHPHEGTVGALPAPAAEGYNGRTGKAAGYTDTPAAADGTTSIRFAGTAATYFTDTGLSTSTGNLVWSAPLLLPSLPASGAADRFLAARTATAAIASVQVTSTGVLQLRNGGSRVRATGNVALNPDTWYRVEVMFAGGQGDVRLFDGSGALLEELGPTAVTAGTPTVLRTGAAVTGGPFLVDRVQIADDWLTDAPPPPPPPCGALADQYNASSPPHYDHVVVLMEENWSYDHYVASTAAPFLKQMAADCGSEGNFHAATHPSQPNYMAATSGVASGVGATVANDNIFAQLQNSSLTWKAYEESMPANCSTGSRGPYKPGHNPALYYSVLRLPTNTCAVNDVPLAPALSSDISNDNLPSYAWITPNLCNDWHWQSGCPETSSARVAAGDAWLANLVPQLTALTSYQNGRTLIVITWDEGEGGVNGVDCTASTYYPTHPDCHIPTVVLSPYIRPGTVDISDQNLYSLLGTIEQNFGLAPLGRAGEYTQSMRPRLGF